MYFKNIHEIFIIFSIFNNFYFFIFVHRKFLRNHQKLKYLKLGLNYDSSVKNYSSISKIIFPRNIPNDLRCLDESLVKEKLITEFKLLKNDEIDGNDSENFLEFINYYLYPKDKIFKTSFLNIFDSTEFLLVYKFTFIYS